jgi:hypothetical protein
MSLAAFQRAMADMAASPALCGRVLRDAGEALAAYALTPLERERLASAAAQRGMRLNCMLYRSNRLGPLAAQLPGTFHLLGHSLRAVAQGFWDEHPAFPRSMPAEVRRFADWLRGGGAGTLPPEPLLPEVLEWEMETYELALLPPERTRAEVADAAARVRADMPLRPHPLVGVARFSRDPSVLVPALAEKRPLPYDDAAPGEYHRLVDFRGERRALTPLDIDTAAAFRALRAGAALSPAGAAALVERGLAIAA